MPALVSRHIPLTEIDVCRGCAHLNQIRFISETHVDVFCVHRTYTEAVAQKPTPAEKQLDPGYKCPLDKKAEPQAPPQTEEQPIEAV